MTWVTWRQSRTELLIGGVALALVAAFLLWTGVDLRSDYKSLGVADCFAESDRSNLCQETLASFAERVENVRDLAMWLILLPLLLGVLLAAPVMLDLEHGTYRLAWTQGVTRRHWFLIKVGLALIVMTLASLALMGLWRWWGEPFGLPGYTPNRFATSLFDNEGIVIVAYTVFAFALCLAVGTILRRSVPAFGIALVGFVAIRVGIEERLRPQYLEPKKIISDQPIPPERQLSDDVWFLEMGPSDQFGNLRSFNDPAVRECFDMRFSKGPVPESASVETTVADQLQCFRDNDIYMTTIYHPEDRYWIFQGIESAIFLGMAAILLGITFYWVTRRIAR